MGEQGPLQFDPEAMRDIGHRTVDALVEAGLARDFKDAIESDDETIVVPVVVKALKERTQRNGQMMCFVACRDRAGQEVEAPCFSGVWRHAVGLAKKGEAYLVTFSRKLDEPERLIVVKPGFMHGEQSCKSYFIRIDDLA